MSSVIYDLKRFNPENGFLDNSMLILAIDEEDRSKHVLNIIARQNNNCRSAIVFIYGDQRNFANELELLKMAIHTENINIIDGFSMTQNEFVSCLKQCSSLTQVNKIIIDISCILTPYLFLLMKCIYMWNHDAYLYAINTVPFDYSFSKSPFTSYKSYYGDLKNEEIIGFSSMQNNRENSDLFIFSGFEGALALKVVEDTEFSNLVFVNALPSYYQKYKDISIINNYQLLQSRNCSIKYTPANNPFEVYNFLDSQIDDDECVSIAPLCAKPVSLGICMYALVHQNIRIVYPFSDRYEHGRSYKVFDSYIFTILFNNLDSEN